MNTISTVYRVACREIELPKAEKDLFMRLLREISVNAIKSQKSWNIKADFVTLFFMSAGRYPELAISPYSKIIGDWIAAQLPFEMSQKEIQDLWN